MFGNQQVRPMEMYLKKMIAKLKRDPWGSNSWPYSVHKACYDLDSCMCVFKVSESSGEVEVLMERMKQLQECRDEEEASQEEMATRFEREKTESMLVVTSGKCIITIMMLKCNAEWLVLNHHVRSTEDEECVPSRDVSRHFEDPSYGYKDFSRRGEHVPTLRVQVRLKWSCLACWRTKEIGRIKITAVWFLPSTGLQLGRPWLFPCESAVSGFWTASGWKVPDRIQFDL